MKLFILVQPWIPAENLRCTCVYIVHVIPVCVDVCTRVSTSKIDSDVVIGKH